MPRAIDPDLLAEINQEKTRYGGGGGLSFYEVPEDTKTHTLRVLPGTFGRSKKKWFVASAQHWSNRKAFECPKAAERGECPFCDAVKELREQEKAIRERQKKATEDEQPKIERQLKKIGNIIGLLAMKSRYLLNIVDRGEPGNIVRVFRAPKTVFTPISEQWENADDIDVLDPLNGHDFKVKRTKTNGRTSYTVQAALSASPISADQDDIDKILSKLPNLESLVKFSTESDLKDACSEAIGAAQVAAKTEPAKAKPPVGEDEEVVEEEPEPETPPPAKKAPAAKVAPAKEPEPEPAAEPEPSPEKGASAKNAGSLKDALNALMEDN